MSIPPAIEELRCAWQAEQEEATRRDRERREGKTLTERIATGVALRGLSVGDVATVSGGRLRLRISTEAPDALEGFDGRPGTPVLLWVESPDEEGATRGVIGRTAGESLDVVIEGDLHPRYDTPGFRLDLESPATTFERGRRALDALADGHLPRWLWEAYAGELRTRPRSTSPIELRATAVQELNQAQLSAVSQAFEREPVTLIHGPPGTGKTRTLAALATVCVRRQEKVLASAASNTAVDNLAHRCAELGLRVVRLGHPARVASELESLTLDAQLEETTAWKLAQQWFREAADLRRRTRMRAERGQGTRQERREAHARASSLVRDARAQIRGAQEAILSRAEIVCVTASSAGTRMLDDLSFDRVLLDEASQCPDPLALIPLSRAPRAVLAGDPLQLPPTVVSTSTAARPLETTLLERIIAQGHEGAYTLLREQYRMHEKIMRFSSETLYSSELVAADSVCLHRLEELAVRRDPDRDAPVVFVDIAGRGWMDERDSDSGSTFNECLAERTAKEVRRLLSRGITAMNVAVITPYAAQRARLRALLGTELRAGLEIDTIDGFQGRGKEAVVVDLVRSNEAAELGFLRDTRRMNVALTRARRFLLVLGDSATLGSHDFYGAFLKSVEADGVWVSVWTDNAEAFA